MRKLGAIAVGFAGLVLIGGCSGGGADKDGDGSISHEEMRAEMGDNPMSGLRAGKYEQVMTIDELDMPGLPKQAREMMKAQMGRTITTTHCLTPEQAQKPDADFFGGKDNNGCTYEEFDRSGNQLKLKMSCKAGRGGESHIAMHGKFGGDGFTMKMENTVSGMGKDDMKVKGSITSRRLGDCDS